MKKFLLMLFFTISCFAQSVGEDVNAFAFSLSKAIDNSDENTAFSPYGIFSNLSLLSFGGEGKTAEQIQTTLHMSETGEKFLKTFHRQMDRWTRPHEGGYQLNISNGLFPHQGTHFLKNFEELAKTYYGAKLQSIDYEVPDSALNSVNEWISEKTGGLIPALLEESDINKDTRLIIANAVYFQGSWVFPFHKKDTKIKPFHSEFGQSQMIPTLQQTRKVPYFENDSVQCVALPFIRKGTMQPFLECLIVLPKKGLLKDLEDVLTEKELDQWLYNNDPALVNIQIPKFCNRFRINLNETLKEMGMKQPFTYQANFSKIDGLRDLFLNKVLHETYFSFHEEGVTAASATTSHLGVTSMPPQEETDHHFIADHPFLFFIVDYHSRAILFMGHVMKPELENCNEN